MIQVSLKEAERHLGKLIEEAADRFIGTSSAEQEAEVLGVVEIFEQVNESFWR